MDMNLVWFVLFIVLIIGYAVLDGFDLGVGIINLFTKVEKEKRININAIGPVWDGNEVWLLTGGGALFAAFPVVYATIFSGFYLAFILLLVALIFRAVSFEFRKYTTNEKNKKYWDLAFGLGSLVPALLYGVAVGNILKGLPVEMKNNQVFASISFFELLNPYAILVGLISVILFVLHGAIYMALKSEGEQHKRMVNLIGKAWIAFVVIYFAGTFTTFFVAPYLFENVLGNFLFWILLVILFVSIISIPVMTKSGKYGYAFLSSSIMILVMIGLTALSLFPKLVPSSINLENSLTIYNSSSSQTTLNTMFIIALIGVPIVLAYTIFIYRIFKGKVILTKDSY